jgi:hypothetical protein
MSDVKHHLVQLFLRRLFLLGKVDCANEIKYDRWQLDALEFALIELTKLFPDESEQAERTAAHINAASVARRQAQ